jgi:chromosome segregation protein
MAEVTLTFKNDGNVPPQYAAYDQIAVTRRLHRDGTSEYLINRTPVRLRDITDLFLGTGVGTRAYSIIEQGRIGFIVSARPEDRRSIIEEVAGITKFKARKKAAERRMDATEQNLVRVTDIVNELERQLGSLRRQAKKAERYKELRAEQRELELHAATMELMRLRAAEKMQCGERNKLEARLQECTAALAAVEAEIEAERVAMVGEERSLRDQQEASAAADTALAALERDLEHWRRQLVEATVRAQQAATDVDTAKARVSQARTERRDLEEQIRDLEGQVQEDHAQCGTLAAAANRKQATAHASAAELEELRRVALEHVHGAAQQRTVAANLDRQRTDLHARIGQTTAERDDLVRRRDAAVTRREQVETAREENLNQLAKWRDRLSGLGEQLERVAAAANESDARVLALKGEITERRSRLESLNEIARRLEGYSDGVRSLLRAGEANEGEEPTSHAAVDGIDGLVTDIIDAPSKYERAIESVLGDKLQYLIVEGQKVGMRAIEYLKECAGGRSGFIPREPRTRAVTAMTAAEPGIVGPALACVNVQPAYEAIAEYLLGDVVIAESLSAALGLWSRNGKQHTIVTLDGEVLEPAGVLAGGSDDGAGLLAKRREARELEERVRELDRKLALAKAEHDELERTRLQLEINTQQLNKDIHSADLERVQHDKDLEAVTSEVTQLGERLEVLGYEIEQLNDDLLTLESDQRRALGAASEAEAAQASVEGQISAKQAEMQQQNLELEQHGHELTALKVQLAGREEKLSSMRQAIERLHLDEVELSGRIDKTVSSIGEDTGTAGALKQRIADAEERTQELASGAEERRVALSQARAVYEEKRVRVDESERAMRERRGEGDLVREALSEVRIDLQRLEMERQRLLEQVRDRHDVNLLKIAGDYHLRPLPGPAHNERLRQLDRALKNIGPINLTAIDECAEIETRYAFLTRQRDDLTTALESLRRAIGRINRASRERFGEAFDAVNDMFMKVFPRLFRGGEARLELANSEDLLEAGVEIVAQPPGKKLQSVNLLSGGEKALTATALVFAIFLVKPSPFCVLDEVDAPLDDANVGRFNEMLRDISKMSQFIVITHNKLTMAEADRLYGITMEEPGMSKVVSVDLAQASHAAA